MERQRYWIYVHDPDGELEYDLGETQDRELAIEKAIAYLYRNPSFDFDNTVGVVDKETQSTIWRAGPSTGGLTA